MSYSGLQWIAGVALGRMLFCLAEGTALAVLIAFVVRLLPQRNSRTRFLIWLSALVAAAMLPLFYRSGWSSQLFGEGPRADAVNLPASAATYIVAGWAIFALAGLARVAAGLWSVREMKANGRETPAEALSPELLAEVEDCRKSRPIRLLVSTSVNVPTAFGFFEPAVLLPEWLVQDGRAEDLKHVVLHELAHLRRWDDWTNLLQKSIKALLFFHPAIWWIEWKLSLDREMACDDAVLEKTASPRNYAESLARMAEKSFLRRQIALAQAAVGRVRQLSLRVTRILDPKRPAAVGAWKPAVPAVLALSVISGVGLSWVPEMVNVEAPGKSISATSRVAVPGPAEIAEQGTGAGAWQATLSAPDTAAPALYHPAKLQQEPGDHRRQGKLVTAAAKQRKQVPIRNADYRIAKHANTSNTQTGFVLLVTTQQTFTATPSGWRVSVTETRWLVPAKVIQKQTPNKT